MDGIIKMHFWNLWKTRCSASLFWLNVPACLHFVCLYNTANHTQRYTIIKQKLIRIVFASCFHPFQTCNHYTVVSGKIIKTVWHFLHVVWSQEWSSTWALSRILFITLDIVEKKKRINPKWNLFLSFSFPLSPALNHTDFVLVRWSYCTLQSS